MRYISNPPNPWLSTHPEWIGEPPTARLEVFEETETRSIITTEWPRRPSAMAVSEPPKPEPTTTASAPSVWPATFVMRRLHRTRR